MTLSGDGTITGLVAGGLPNATVTADDLAAGAALNNAPDSVGFRNRIINGGMVIDQRNAGASVSVDNTNAYTVDRWQAIDATTGVFTVQQDTSAPEGFNYSAKVTVTTADASLTTTEQAYFRQVIEGYNIADLGWGTANAKTVTLSFWVRSSLTGTFGGTINNNAFNRAYPFTYAISSTDTWEYKTVTISGDTSGTWETTTSRGIIVIFSLGGGPDRLATAGAWASSNYSGATGQVNPIGTLNATWYITGVQLEAGSVATPFERRPYGTELALCQRYYYRITPGDQLLFSLSFGRDANRVFGFVNFPTSMRVAPSSLEQTGTASDYRQVNQVSGTESVCSSVPTFGSANNTYSQVIFNFSGSITTGFGGLIASNSANAFLGWSAEL